MSDKNSSKSKLADNPIIIIIGLIASCIGIFAFITGRPSLGILPEPQGNNFPVYTEESSNNSPLPESPSDTSPGEVVVEPTADLVTQPQQSSRLDLMYEISVINTFGATTDVFSFSSNGSLFAMGCKQDVCIYDINTGGLSKRLYGHNETVNAVTFSQNPQLLASGSQDGDIFIWNLNSSDSPITKIHQMEDWGDPEYSIYAIAFLPNNSTIAVADSSMKIHLYDVNSGNAIQTLTLGNNYANRLTVSANGKYVAATSDYKTVSVWDITSGRSVFDWESSGDPKFSPDGSYVALSNSNGDGINLYDASGGNIKMRFTSDYQKSYQAYSFSPDGKLIFGCRDDIVDVWRISDGSLFAEIEIDTNSNSASWCWDVQISPDGKHLATITFGGPLRIWKLNLPNN